MNYFSWLIVARPLHEIGAQSVYIIYTPRFAHACIGMESITWHREHDLAYLAEMQDRLGEAGLHGVQGMADTSQTSSRLCMPYAALACGQAQRQCAALRTGV